MELFLIDVRFIAPIEEVNALLADHLAWLEEHTAKGMFFAWGPKDPRNGGFILAKAESRSELEALVLEDPYLIGKVATSTVIGWKPRFAAPQFEGLRP